MGWKSKKFKEKKFVLLAIALIISIALIIFFINQQEIKQGESEVKIGDLSLEERLDEIYSDVRSGGPPPDGIPPIENPKYISMEEADSRLDDKDVVFLVEMGEEIFIYPQKILVWHEIVNEEIGGEKVSITYCPLTGSALGFKGKVLDVETTFGTSGKLSNSNLVMYDRETRSYIPQIFGIAVSGELKGERLEEFPVVFTRWENVKQVYDKAQVLSENTGYIRNYNSDPYGSYLDSGNYYDSGKPFFPVMHKDNRFEDKEVVMGARIGENPVAILKKSVAEKKILNFEVNNVSLVAFYDESLDTIRLFERTHEGSVLEFIFANGQIVDEETGSVWNPGGEAVSGNLEGTQLNYINSFDVMWFSWVAFYPETEVFE